MSRECVQAELEACTKVVRLYAARVHPDLRASGSAHGGGDHRSEITLGGIHFYRVHKRCIYERTAVRARVGTTVLMPRAGMHHMRTQHMPLSARTVQTSYNHRDVGTKRIVLLMDCAPIHHRRTVAVDWM